MKSFSKLAKQNQKNFYRVYQHCYNIKKAKVVSELFSIYLSD